MKILRYTYIILVIFCFYPALMSAQEQQYLFQSKSPIVNLTLNENDTTRYKGHFRFENAYKQIEAMLTDKRPLDFAEAIFAVENCMYDGQLDHAAYIAEINRIANGIKQMVATKAITAPSRDMALNYAIFVFYTQPCPLNNNHPYEYDQSSLMSDAGLTGGMVSLLLKTGKGTCHSLPFLYKIIADKVGAKAYIANAPLHSYIRHQDFEGNWWNFETTTGNFSRSSYIMESFHINENAIKSGLYMTNLTAKETIVQCLYDLLCIYERKTGFYSNEFVRKCYTLGLKYHHADNLQTFRLNDLKYQLDKKAWNKGLRSEAEIRKDKILEKEYEYLQQQRQEFAEMGYYAFTTEEYTKKYQEALDYLRSKNAQQTK